MRIIPRIETISPRKLVGRSLEMSMVENKTYTLWSSFMPLKKQIKHIEKEELYSLQIYPPTQDFKNFNPHLSFTKWAAIEVSKIEEIPDSLNTFNLPGGLYAVFIHKGLSSDFPKTAQYIFGEWLPNAPYGLDNRPHFELLGEKYKNNDPASEEEVWIPIRQKQ